MKKATQWTDRLASLADEEEGKAKAGENGTVTPLSGLETHIGFSDPVTDFEVNTPLRLEGPYFTAANPRAYKTVICLVAGTGLSGAIAITAAFQAQRKGLPPVPEASMPTTAPACSAAAMNNDHWDRCIVIWSVRESDFVDMPFFNGRPVRLPLVPSRADNW